MSDDTSHEMVYQRNNAFIAVFNLYRFVIVYGV
jgi:hypothetical protein